MVYLVQAIVLLAAAGVVLAVWLNNRRLRRELADAARSAQSSEAERRREEERRATAARDLQIKDAFYQVLFNSAWDMFFIHGITPDGLAGKFQQVNDVACERLEQTRERLLQLTPSDIEDVEKPSSMARLYSRTELVALTDSDIHYRETTSERQLMSQILESAEVHYERVYLTRTGKKLPVEIRARHFDLMGAPLVLYTARDITERKKSERALRDGQQRLRDLLVHSPIGLAMYDSARNLVDVNQAALQMFGAPGDTGFAKVNLFDNPFMPPEVKETAAKGETVRYEAALDFDHVQREAIFVTSRRGKAFFDILILNLGLDRDFNPKGYLVEIQDVTRRRQAEAQLREKERQLRQAQKMEAIGTLASGIAHDFNNILTPIMGYTDMILQTTAQDDIIHEYMQEVLKASHRAKELVNQILAFSRQTEPGSTRIRITPIAKEVLRLIETTLPPGIETARVLKAEQDTVRADPTQIHQVLMNLCTNAVHAMRQTGGTLEIRTSSFVMPSHSSREFPHLEAGRYIRLSVRDTGCGMDEATMERIFEPFFTTKSTTEGTGMGLAVVHGIVSGLKGAISVESRPGKGSTFHVVLPTVEAEAQLRVTREKHLPRGDERVLFVDDEPDILRMIEYMLGGLGYKVRTFSKPVEALWEFRSHPAQFDLVITDQVMPGMQGDELAREMLATRPDLPIILCTGFSETISPRQAAALGIREFVMKPIVTSHLAEAMRRALA